MNNDFYRKNKYKSAVSVEDFYPFFSISDENVKRSKETYIPTDCKEYSECAFQDVKEILCVLSMMDKIGEPICFMTYGETVVIPFLLHFTDTRQLDWTVKTKKFLAFVSKKRNTNPDLDEFMICHINNDGDLVTESDHNNGLYKTDINKFYKNFRKVFLNILHIPLFKQRSYLHDDLSVFIKEAIKDERIKICNNTIKVI